MILAAKNLIFDTRIDTNKLYVSMKTRFVLRKNTKKTSPLYLHITGGGLRERLHLDILIQNSFWSEKKQRLNISKVEDELIRKNMNDLNLIIDNVEAKITNIKTVYRLSETVLTPKKLKKELLEDLPRVNFCSFFQRALNDEKTILKPGTFRKLQSVLNKIKKYDENVIFSDLNLKWFDRYKIYMSKMGNQKTTINSNLKSIKKFLRKALKVGIKIPCDLDDIKAGSTSGTKISLQPFELKKLKKFYDSEFIIPSHKLMLGYFLFSCVTGLRFNDVMNIKREEISDEFIQFKAEKVDKMQSIALNKVAKEIISSCENLFIKYFTNEYINRELKVIMRNLGIKKKVTFHVSRHTFATSFLRAGGKIEKLQLLMGHSKITQTRIYCHIVAADANKEIFLLDNLF